MLVQNDGSCVIGIPGNLSGTAVDDFQKRLDGLLAGNPPGWVALDCSQLNQVTSSHINILWWARCRCETAGLSIRLLSPTDRLLRVLRALDLCELFTTDAADTARISVAEDGSVPQELKWTLRLEFRPEVDSINAALKKFRGYLDTLRVAEQAAFELETVFYEVATNIRLHGRVEGEGTIAFMADNKPDGLEMTFIDPGQPFDVNSLPGALEPIRAMKEKQTRGFGLVMVRRMTDEVRYQRKDDRYNVLTLEKHWR